MGTMLFLSISLFPPSFAQIHDEGQIAERSALTGDWYGERSTLADHGVSLDVRYTAFYQGLASGTGDTGYEYGGKIDGLIDSHTSKMGFWENGRFFVHLEYSHGDAPPNLGGAIFSVNTAVYWPVDTPNELVATSLNYTHKLGPRSSIAVGKFNPVDVYEKHPITCQVTCSPTACS
jgi:porin